MLERLNQGLRQLSALPAKDLATDAGIRLRGDCADALRLELDCPQQTLTPVQRTALSALSDVLEEGTASGTEVIAAARRAYRALVGASPSSAV